jgi:hypothetical protein
MIRSGGVPATLSPAWKIARQCLAGGEHAIARICCSSNSEHQMAWDLHEEQE